MNENGEAGWQQLPPPPQPAQYQGQQQPWPPQPPQYPGQRAGGRRWLWIGALALALALMFGVGAVIGPSLLGTAQAASLPGGGVQIGRAHFDARGPGDAGRQGKCGVLTVSSVNGDTIVAKNQDGTTVTIHTTSSTQYAKAGQSAKASDVTTGTQIHVDDTTNSDGSISATRIDIR